MCVYIYQHFWESKVVSLSKSYSSWIRKKTPRLDSDNHNNQNNSFQDIVNLQFILLCNAERIAGSIDGITTSVMLLEKQQNMLCFMVEEHGGGRSKALNV